MLKKTRKKIRMYALAFKYWSQGDSWFIAKKYAKKMIYWSFGKGI